MSPLWRLRETPALVADRTTAWRGRSRGGRSLSDQGIAWCLVGGVSFIRGACAWPGLAPFSYPSRDGIGLGGNLRRDGLDFGRQRINSGLVADGGLGVHRIDFCGETGNGCGQLREIFHDGSLALENFDEKAAEHLGVRNNSDLVGLAYGYAEVLNLIGCETLVVGGCGGVSTEGN